tara:strand:- start:15 stop:737 length:723 start_codon:yes stop_codon:yes gene_type:complete
MGKRLIQQRRGRGTTRYRSPGHNSLGPVFHKSYDEVEKTSLVDGKIVDIINCVGHNAPLVVIQYESGEISTMFASQGVYTGKKISSGSKAKIEKGNIVPLKNTKIGTNVFNIEEKVGDGGKYVRSAGSFATVVAKTANNITLKMPSKKSKNFNPNCRAVIGIVAGAGKKEKPILKAGKRHYIMKAKNKLYPQTSGVAMNAYDHPFGSGRGRHIGKAKTVSRNAPPGRKVGSVSSRRTGKK